MRFTLHYSGPLYANGRPDHKHEIRRVLHAQLAELWKHEPLSGLTGYQRPKDDPTRKTWEVVSSVRSRGAFTFVPLATTELKLIADLEVLLLRPEPPGRLVTQGGDIDNRMKTLLDALSLPQADGLPKGATPAADETPFYVVLEDDNLITSLTVKTEHLLKPNDSNHVELLLRFHVTSTSPTWGNNAFK
jgi:hypothetical protein